MSTFSIRAAIERAIQRSPATSMAGILREIRSAGFRISNQSGREIIRNTRAQLDRIAQDVERGVVSIGDDLRGRRFTDFTYRENEIRGMTRQTIEEQLRQNNRSREVFVFRGARGDRLSDFTQAQVQYRANYVIDTSVRGTHFATTSGTQTGQFVSDVTAFTEEGLAERVIQQLTGIAILGLTRDLGIPEGSVVEGLNANVQRVDIQIVQVQGRGSRGNARRR